MFNNDAGDITKGLELSDLELHAIKYILEELATEPKKKSSVILPCVMYLLCVFLSCKRAKNVYAMCALFDVYLIIVSCKQNLSHVADIRHTTKM